MTVNWIRTRTAMTFKSAIGQIRRLLPVISIVSSLRQSVLLQSYVALGAQSHVSSTVNNFVLTNGGEFLRVANFHFACSACASAGINPVSEFQ